MDTIPALSDEGRRRRRKHSAEFKAHVVASCCKPGVSMASVALANGVNANLVRRWVVESDAAAESRAKQRTDVTSKSLSAPASFIPVQLPATPVATDISIEVTRGPIKFAVTWPATAAAECAAWMRELLR